MDDARVAAIRADKVIGRGSCSSVDECMTDEELVAELDGGRIWTPEAAVHHFQVQEKLRNDYEDDVRGAGNVSPLHSPREPGHVYDDDSMSAEEAERDAQQWKREIAREEGMLNGIDSYNDWSE